MTDDAELLRSYVREHSEEAFAELVRRHLDLVYSAALRRLGGDTHGAADVAQRVFCALARQAPALSHHTLPSAWLYSATRNIAIDHVRAEIRRQTRDQEAHVMHAMNSPDGSATDADWARLRPLLDRAMDELGERDRVAVLLRYFEHRSFTEIGVALGLSEDAARMRVERALEKLRARLGRRGVTSTGVALSAVLVHQAIAAAPPGLAVSVTGAAVASAAGTSAVTPVWAAIQFMSTSKIVSGLAVLAIGAVGGWGIRDATLHRASDTTTLASPSTPPSVASSWRLATATKDVNPAGSKGQVESWKRVTSLIARESELNAEEKRLVNHARIVMYQDRIHAGFAEFFALSPGQQDVLELGVKAARTEVRELEVLHSRAHLDKRGNLVIEVQPFPERGGPILDRLLAQFAEAMGPERFRAFLDLRVQRYLASSLGGFGLVKTTMIVTHSPSSQREPYVIEREHHTAPVVGRVPATVGKYAAEILSSGGYSGSSHKGFLDRRSLEEELGDFAKVVPADF